MQPKRVATDVFKAAASHRRIFGVFEHDHGVGVDPCLDVTECETGVAEFQAVEMDMSDVGVRIYIALGIDDAVEKRRDEFKRVRSCPADEIWISVEAESNNGSRLMAPNTKPRFLSAFGIKWGNQREMLRQRRMTKDKIDFTHNSLWKQCVVSHFIY